MNTTTIASMQELLSHPNIYGWYISGIIFPLVVFAAQEISLVSNEYAKILFFRQLLNITAIIDSNGNVYRVTLPFNKQTLQFSVITPSTF